MCLEFFSYGFDPQTGHCFWVCSQRSFVPLCDLSGLWSGMQAIAVMLEVCVSTLLYPQVVDRYHLCS